VRETGLKALIRRGVAHPFHAILLISSKGLNTTRLDLSSRRLVQVSELVMRDNRGTIMPSKRFDENQASPLETAKAFALNEYEAGSRKEAYRFLVSQANSVEEVMLLMHMVLAKSQNMTLAFLAFYAGLLTVLSLFGFSLQDLHRWALH
jgi:hypothetical protein